MLSFFSHRLISAAVLLAGLTALNADAAPHSVSSQAAPAREFRLFVGVDLKVLDEGEMHEISDFDKRRAILEGPEKKQIDESDLGSIQFVPTTKLSRRPLTIANIDVRRGFSITEDAKMDSMISQNNLQTYSQDRLQQLELSVISAAAFGPSGPIEVDGQVIDVPDVREALNEFQDFQRDNAITSDDEFFTQNDGREDPEKFNAIMITAEVSSPVPVADTYAVCIARIRTDEARSRDMIIFHEIGQLTPEPRAIEIQKPGLPPGFEVLEIDLHVFCEGQELVSDQSEKQFALTRDEAIEYLVLERVSSHRGQSLPAEPAWSLAPPALLGSDTPEDFDIPLPVHIDKRGRVTKIDESTIAPAPIAEIVSVMFFLPAIHDGTAVPSTTQINLASFFR